MDALASNLRHVYFFLEAEAPTRLHTASKGLKPIQTSAQPAPMTVASASTHGSGVSSPCLSSVSATTKASSPQLSANAPTFVPSPTKVRPDAPVFIPCPTESDHSATQPDHLPHPHVNDFFEVRDVPGKGKGITAIRDIIPGKRILLESPLLRIQFHNITAAWDKYQALKQEQKAAYDSLCSMQNQAEHLEHESRALLLSTSQGISEDGFETLVKECTRVLSIYKANAYEVDGGSAVFNTASRFNHACVPNVHHTFNTELQGETLHTTRHIKAGEELTTNYMGQMSYYKVHTQRWEWLRENYDFTCQCVACTDLSGIDNSRRELLYAITWGLTQFRRGSTKKDVPEGSEDFVPKDTAQSYDQALDVIEVIKALGLRCPELALAYRMASEVAFELGKYEAAIQLALLELNLDHELHGDDEQKVDPRDKTPIEWIGEIRMAAHAAIDSGRPDLVDTPHKKSKKKHSKKKPNKGWNNKKGDQSPTKDQGSQKDRSPKKDDKGDRKGKQCSEDGQPA